METNFASGSGDNIFDDNIFSATDIGEYDHNTATHLDVSDFFRPRINDLVVNSSS
jgi:hypothetical protein